MELDYKVYYVIQTFPKWKVCGYCFNRDEAKSVSKLVKQITGRKGHIVEYTRSELKELGYK